MGKINRGSQRVLKEFNVQSERDREMNVAQIFNGRILL
jgi:hypothetical protein